MVRIDARTVTSPIDWNADGDSTDSAFALDINFNGRFDGPHRLQTGPRSRLLVAPMTGPTSASPAR